MMLKFTLVSDYEGKPCGTVHIDALAISCVQERQLAFGSVSHEHGYQQERVLDAIYLCVGGRWMHLDAENGEALKRILAAKATSVNISFTDDEAKQMRQFYGPSEANRGR